MKLGLGWEGPQMASAILNDARPVRVQHIHQAREHGVSLNRDINYPQGETYVCIISIYIYIYMYIYIYIRIYLFRYVSIHLFIY